MWQRKKRRERRASCEAIAVLYEWPQAAQCVVCAYGRLLVFPVKSSYLFFEPPFFEPPFFEPPFEPPFELPFEVPPFEPPFFEPPFLLPPAFLVAIGCCCSFSVSC